MTEFQEMVQADIKNVFLDLSMFGESHIVEGRERTIIIDDMEKIKRNEYYQDQEAVYSKRLLFYIAAEDMGKLPDIGRLIEVDGEMFRVVQAEDESGIFAVTIEAYMQQ